MMSTPLTIGLVFETREDALRLAQSSAIGGGNLENFTHWREPHELDAIQEALEKAGHRVERIGPPQALLKDFQYWEPRIQLIFNLSVGFLDRFRMSTGPALFHLARFPFTGADAWTKMISQHKSQLKLVFQEMGIPTPAWQYVHHPSQLIPEKLPPFPVIVKPAHEGSSVGIYAKNKAQSVEEVRELLKEIHSTLKMPAIVEQFISGREFKVGYIGHQDISFRGMLEDIGPEGDPLGERFLHFGAKYGNMQKRKADLSEEKKEEIYAYCDRIFSRFLPVDYASFDLRMDENGAIWFLEFQADASLHPERTFASILRLNGPSYEQGVQLILKTALDRLEFG